jgi:hypothetical protein
MNTEMEFCRQLRNADSGNVQKMPQTFVHRAEHQPSNRSEPDVCI